jgi:hypothetical protein
VSGHSYLVVGSHMPFSSHPASLLPEASKPIWRGNTCTLLHLTWLPPALLLLSAFNQQSPPVKKQLSELLTSCGSDLCDTVHDMLMKSSVSDSISWGPVTWHNYLCYVETENQHSVCIK